MAAAGFVSVGKRKELVILLPVPTTHVYFLQFKNGVIRADKGSKIHPSALFHFPTTHFLFHCTEFNFGARVTVIFLLQKK